MSLWGAVIVVILSVCAVGVGIRNCACESNAPTPRVEGGGVVDGQRRVERALEEHGEEVRSAVREAMGNDCDWASAPVPDDVVHVLDEFLCDGANRKRSAAVGVNAPVRDGESAL